MGDPARNCLENEANVRGLVGSKRVSLILDKMGVRTILKVLTRRQQGPAWRVRLCPGVVLGEPVLVIVGDHTHH